MPVADVVKAIHHGRKVIDLGAEVELHEPSTRYFIIDPILRALGWQLENPKHCLVEEWRTLKNQAKVADYVLRDRNGEKAILVEAKGWSKTKLYGWTEENQLAAYAEGESAQRAVLTNGQFWCFYDLQDEGSENRFRSPRASNVDIYENDTPETANQAARILHRALNRRKHW